MVLSLDEFNADKYIINYYHNIITCIKKNFKKKTFTVLNRQFEIFQCQEFLTIIPRQNDIVSANNWHTLSRNVPINFFNGLALRKLLLNHF